MAQDFAKQRMPTGVRRKPTVRAATRTAPASQSSHWSWYFSGLMSGVIVAIAAYLGLLKLDADSAETPQIVQATEDPVEAQPTFNFGFYKNLENAEVTVSPPPVEPSPAAAPPPAAPQAAGDGNPAATNAVATTAPAPGTPTASPTTQVATASTEKQSNYLLQVGSFQNRKDAESHRARVIMLNMDADIVAAVVSGRTVQRVLVGPYGSRASAEEARELLSENGIDSIPLLMR